MKSFVQYLEEDAEEEKIKRLEAKPYHRFTRSPKPFQGVDYAMFSDDMDHVSHYGDYHHTLDPDDVPKSKVVYAGDRKFERKVLKALQKEEDEVLFKFGVDNVKELLDELNPDNIVDTAQFWDAPVLAGIVFEEVLGPEGIDIVLTYDGAIVFDEKWIETHGKTDII